MSRGRSSYRARSSSPRTTMKSEDPLRCGENVLDSMWIPEIATLGRVGWPLRGTCLFTLSRDDHEAEQAYVDGLAGSDTPRGRELRPVDPRATHASEIAQPVGALLVGDTSVLARHRKVGELDRALRPATDGRAGLRHVECRSRAALCFESEGDPIRGRRLAHARGEADANSTRSSTSAFRWRERFMFARKARWPVMAAAIAGLLLSACAPTTTTGTGSPTPGASAASKVLRMARNAEPFSPFVPWQIDDNPALFISVNIYDTLLRTTKDGTNVEPGLATKWESTADGLNWTFTLKDGVKFSDGSAMKASDVKASLD